MRVYLSLSELVNLLCVGCVPVGFLRNGKQKILTAKVAKKGQQGRKEVESGRREGS